MSKEETKKSNEAIMKSLFPAEIWIKIFGHYFKDGSHDPQRLNLLAALDSVPDLYHEALRLYRGSERDYLIHLDSFSYLNCKSEVFSFSEVQSLTLRIDCSRNEHPDLKQLQKEEPRLPKEPPKSEYELAIAAAEEIEWNTGSAGQFAEWLSDQKREEAALMERIKQWVNCEHHSNFRSCFKQFQPTLAQFTNLQTLKLCLPGCLCADTMTILEACATSFPHLKALTLHMPSPVVEPSFERHYYARYRSQFKKAQGCSYPSLFVKPKGHDWDSFNFHQLHDTLGPADAVLCGCGCREVGISWYFEARMGNNGQPVSFWGDVREWVDAVKMTLPPKRQGLH